MTAWGYCSYYLEHCSKTNHVAIKGVIQRAKYKSVFGLVAYLKNKKQTKYADKDKNLGSLNQISYL